MVVMVSGVDLSPIVCPRMMRGSWSILHHSGWRAACAGKAESSQSSPFVMLFRSTVSSYVARSDLFTDTDAPASIRFDRRNELIALRLSNLRLIA